MKESEPVVVIIGAGFGGLHAAKELRNAPVKVCLLDKNNFHLFQPLLYQVATALLALNEIAYPVRAIFRKQKNLIFQLTEVTGIDLDAHRVHTTTGTVQYDYLVLAVGGETNYFGLDSVKQNGFSLKDLDDALAIRNHTLKMFELSAQLEDEQVRRALRTIVVAGAGPTGIELAGALSELVRKALPKDYPSMTFEDARVIVLEAADRVLAGFPDELADAAQKRLKQRQVDIRLNAAVADFNGQMVTLKSGEVIPACTLIWAAGVRAVSLLDKLGVKQARQGRVVVDETLQVPSHPEVFVIGDAAYLEDDGQSLPMMAPVAIQQGKLAARNIRSMIEAKPLEHFKYRDPGSLATIGRNAAVARIRNFKFEGFLAWLVWLVVHLFWLIGFRNRLLVMINWAWDYFLFERTVRLITPDGRKETEERPWPVDLAALGDFDEQKARAFDRTKVP